ncbi:hypothetical protein fugu_000940 [Takifugu bimaculatus]|uniref:Peptidase S1 domain-containing protein n=1 Tax=Takifugu bimaculatus TaxID=433685 RepID=A0A4Z2CIC1_9TELE|nr:hypothetical protein fugu_000940 [Takifugu bimaculatus]
MTGPLIRSLLLIWATLITRGSVAQANLPASTPLQQVQVPVIGPKQCSCSFSSQVDITSEMICAGEANKGTCQAKLPENAN